MALQDWGGWAALAKELAPLTNALSGAIGGLAGYRLAQRRAHAAAEQAAAARVRAAAEAAALGDDAETRQWQALSADRQQFEEHLMAHVRAQDERLERLARRLDASEERERECLELIAALVRSRAAPGRGGAG